MSIRNILITGVRAPAALFLIRKLHGYGYRIVTAESIGCHVSRFSSCVSANYRITAPNTDPDGFVDDLAEIAAKERIDLIIPTCEEIFYVARGKKRLEGICRVFCDTREKLMELHNKWSFYEKFRNRGYGVLMPQSRYAENLSDLTQIINEGPSGKKYVIKPVYSRFAARVMITDRVPDGLDDGRYIVQDFVEGTQYCSYSVIRDGHVLLHGDYRTDFTAGRGATIAFEYSAHTQIRKFVEDFAAKEDFEGQIAFDFIQGSDGLYLIECNPRLTSGIQLFDKDTDISGIFEDAPFTETLYPERVYRTALIPAMLMFVFYNVHTRADLKKWIKTVMTSRDVIFDLRDPLPFIMQIPVMLMLIAGAVIHGVGIKEISTYDMECNGDE